MNARNLSMQKKQLKTILLVAAGVVAVGAVGGLVLGFMIDEPEKEGPITTTASGLQYADLRPGSGERSVKNADQIVVHYTGTFTDGRKFESSHDKGEPYSLAVGAREVIEGWDEGLLGMKVGGKRKLMVPAKLAYGAKGNPPVIPPNTDLIFVIELVKIF